MFSSVLGIPISFSGNKMLSILSVSTVYINFFKLILINGILVFRKNSKMNNFHECLFRGLGNNSSALVSRKHHHAG